MTFVEPGASIRYTVTVTKPESLRETVALTLTDTAVPTQALSAWELPSWCTGNIADGNFTCTWDMEADRTTTTLSIVITSADTYSGVLINIPGRSLDENKPQKVRAEPARFQRVFVISDTAYLDLDQFSIPSSVLSPFPRYFPRGEKSRLSGPRLSPDFSGTSPVRNWLSRFPTR